MSSISIGILLLIAGLCLMFAGLRLFMVLLPAFGLITGFFLGASIVAGWLGAGFLSTIAEWIVGYVIGTIFATVAFLAWYFGVIVICASVSGMIAMGVMAILDIQTELYVWIAAFVVGVCAARLAQAVRYPGHLMVITTAIGGAIMFVTSLSLIFQKVELREIRWGADWNDINVPWSSWLVLAVLSLLSILTQWHNASSMTFPRDRWMRADRAARIAFGGNHDR